MAAVAESVVRDGRQIRPHIEKSPNQQCPRTVRLELKMKTSPSTISSTPGASVVEVARRHDVRRNLVTAWRRQARTGVLAFEPGPMQRQADVVHFAAGSIAPDRQPLAASSGTCGAIGIEFAAGARMRITGAVDAALTDGRPR